MNMLFRRMIVEDIPAVHEIDTLSFSLPWTERSFRFELTQNPVSRAWVAEVDGRIAAMLVLWFIVDEAHIATIAVHPDFRRQGIGEQICVTLCGLPKVKERGGLSWKCAPGMLPPRQCTKNMVLKWQASAQVITRIIMRMPC